MVYPATDLMAMSGYSIHNTLIFYLCVPLPETKCYRTTPDRICKMERRTYRYYIVCWPTVVCAPLYTCVHTVILPLLM